MLESHREEVVALARRYDAWIIEDASYARLGTGAPRSLAARAPDRVVTLDSFSYCATPALRLGFVSAPPTVAERIAVEAQLTVQSGMAPMQTAVGRWIAADGLARHLRRTLPIFRTRREAMVEALRRTMPPGTRWTEPVGGLSLWATLPEGRYADLYDAALAKGIPFAPGSLFVAEDGERHLRLSYGRHSPETLAGAIAKLADLVRARAR
jgi:DNA-binding transcriptional MocR family regulator